MSWATAPIHVSRALLASVLYSLPFAVQPFAAAFDQVDRKLIEASWTLGLSKFKTFFKLIVPLSAAGLVTGAVLSFAHTLENSGSADGRWQYRRRDENRLHRHLRRGAGAQLRRRRQNRLVLLVISYAVLMLVYAMNRKVLAAWPQN